MHLSIDVEITCTVSAGDAALLMVEARADAEQSVATSNLSVDQGKVTRMPGTGMVWASVPDTALTVRYHAEVEVTRTKTDLTTLAATPAHTLPADVLPLLRPSRYCPSDLFVDFVAETFDGLEGGAKVLAIRDWVAAHLTYTPGSSNAATTAVETFEIGQGVCRDFAHLLCTLARAAHIPARYASVYGAEVTPQDFHAAAQVWLDGAWHLVDATHMGAPHEMAVIATGRDAADVAFMETAEWAEVAQLRIAVTRA